MSGQVSGSSPGAAETPPEKSFSILVDVWFPLMNDVRCGDFSLRAENIAEDVNDPHVELGVDFEIDPSASPVFLVESAQNIHTFKGTGAPGMVYSADKQLKILDSSGANGLCVCKNSLPEWEDSGGAAVLCSVGGKVKSVPVEKCPR